MKITKARLMEIINEEVTDYAKRLQQEESHTLEVSEESLQEMIGVELEEKATKTDLHKAIEDDQKENPGQMDEVEKAKYKGKTYKASASTMKAIRGGGGGAGKVTPAEFAKAKEQAKGWATDPGKVAGAAKIIAKTKAGTMKPKHKK